MLSKGPLAIMALLILFASALLVKFAMNGASEPVRVESEGDFIEEDSIRSTRENPKKYTCPLHPQVVSPDSGACPVCRTPLQELV